MSFRIRGLSPDLFSPYFAMSAAQLREIGAIRSIVESPGLPCRVSLEHAALGDEILLLNYEHLPARSPYRARHAIYVARSSSRAFDAIDQVPETILSRLVSVRAFDADDMMVDAEVLQGTEAAALFRCYLDRDEVRYLHVHNARRGCYAARVDRAG